MLSYTGTLYKYRLFSPKLKSTNSLPRARKKLKQWGRDKDTKVVIKLDL